MHLSVLLPSFGLDFAEALQRAVELGFAHVDVVASADRPAHELEALADSGLIVACAAVGKNLPADHALDVESVAVRRAAVDVMKRQLTDAAQLGASQAYLVPGLERSDRGFTAFADGCGLLSEHASGRRVQLCLEHVPGRALAAAGNTLDWLEQHAGLANLKLLLDVGHCLISGEEPAAIVRRAGSRLGYVHLDDNDGVADLHWPLLEGRLTEATLRSTLSALAEIGYRGALCLELSATNPQPIEAVRRSKAVLERLMG